jgi:FtsP/CotA-like multicopper oxidase with cupredoxin domain
MVGNFPGPLIEGRPGDEIQVELHNNLNNGEGIAIHWHGLSMRGKFRPTLECYSLE